MFTRIGISAVVLVLTLLSVVSINTLRIGSPQIDVGPMKVVDIDADAAAGRLADAIRFPTVSRGPDLPPSTDALRGFQDFLVRSFPKVHDVLTREVINEHSLLYTWHGGDPALKPILFAAHMDVVPVEAGTEGEWTHPPFAGVIADGFVWGRGTMDMKASLTGIMEAVEYLIDRGGVPRRTVYLAFGHDEEVGGPNGAAMISKLLRSRGVTMDFTLDEGLVITEGIVPGVSKPAALIGLAEKGLLTLELVAMGDGGHASMPPARTAVAKLARALQQLENNPMPAQLASPAAEIFEHLASEMPFVMRSIIANRWLFDPLLLHRLEATPATNALIRTTIAPTLISGGDKENVLPQSARAMFSARLLPGDTAASVIEHVRVTINDPDVIVRRGGKPPSEPSAISDVDSSSFAALRQTVRQVFPDVAIAPGLLIGRTDSRYYEAIAENSYRFLPMRLGPLDLKRIHGTDERISVKNYIEIVRFYAQLIRNTAMR